MGERLTAICQKYCHFMIRVSIPVTNKQPRYEANAIQVIYKLIQSGNHQLDSLTEVKIHKLSKTSSDLFRLQRLSPNCQRP